jgi:hypothetical protein
MFSPNKKMMIPLRQSSARYSPFSAALSYAAASACHPDKKTVALAEKMAEIFGWHEV